MSFLIGSELAYLQKNIEITSLFQEDFFVLFSVLSSPCSSVSGKTVFFSKTCMTHMTHRFS